ncbi:MAG: hypothetical protein U1E53_02400 [Dongiaceae bacterium]
MPGRGDGVGARGRRLAAAACAALLIALSAPATAGYQRPFGPLAPWNVPVAGLPRDPQSGLLSERLWRYAPSERPGNFNLGFDTYTYPVYRVQPDTPLVPVKTRRRTNIDGRRIPWDPAWQPAPGDDAQVIILDPATGREWDLWQVEFDGTTLRATNGSLVGGDYRTKEDGNPPSRGIGIQYLAMLIRPEEIIAGRIDHALSMPIRNTDRNRSVPPATKVEGKGPSHDAIPEGTRFALDVTDDEIEDWIAALPDELPEATRRSARILARAMRDYGWFVTDNAGGATIQFEARVTAGGDWARLGLDDREIDDKKYPRDLLDGLITRDRLYAIVPSDRYPAALQPAAAP